MRLSVSRAMWAALCSQCLFRCGFIDRHGRCERARVKLSRWARRQEPATNRTVCVRLERSGCTGRAQGRKTVFDNPRLSETALRPGTRFRAMRKFGDKEIPYRQYGVKFNPDQELLCGGGATGLAAVSFNLPAPVEFGPLEHLPGRRHGQAGATEFYRCAGPAVGTPPARVAARLSVGLYGGRLFERSFADTCINPCSNGRF